MSDEGELEQRYRRLLRWYPRGHRRDHEEEMLDVLIQAAPPGQTRPSWRDAVDVAWGGVRIRTRWVFGAVAGAPAWRDAFAVVSLLLPLLMCTKTIELVVDWVRWDVLDQPYASSSWAGLHSDWPSWVAWPAVVALALTGARRLAASAALAATAVHVALLAVRYVVHDQAITPVMVVWWPMLGLLATTALAISPAGRGSTLLGRYWLLAACAATAVMGYAEAQVDPTRWFPLQNVILPAMVALTALYSARTPTGRRAVVLLIVPWAWFKAVEDIVNTALSPTLSPGAMVALVATAILPFAAFAPIVYALERVVRLIRIGQAAEDAGRAST